MSSPPGANRVANQKRWPTAMPFRLASAWDVKLWNISSGAKMWVWT